MNEEAKLVHSQPLVEDFDLPDIKGMKSQYERHSVLVPLPSIKSPAALAKEEEIKKRRKEKLKELKPVNRNSSTNDDNIENYQVELKKLKKQFENDNAAPPVPATRSRSTSRTKSSLKGSRNSSLEIENTKTRSTKENSTSLDIVKSSDVINDTNYEIQMSVLKSMFNKASFENSTKEQLQPKSLKSTKRRTISSTSLNSDSSFSSMNISTKDEDETFSNSSPTKAIVKSSEPLHEEMIGEESLKDRLLRYKKITNLNETDKLLPKKSLNRKRSSFSNNNQLQHLSSVESKSTDKSQSTENSEKQESNKNPEVVRSSIAGQKEQVDYQLDLKQTKALFESSFSEAFDKSHSTTRRSSIRSNSSRQRSFSSVSSRSSTKSVSSVRSRDDSEINSTLSHSTGELRVMVDTIDVIRPLPAGTKEIVEIQPSVSIKDAKSMFEKQSSGNLKNVDFSKPRRTSLKSSWINSNDSTVTKNNVVKEGSFVESNGIVRPPVAGTKEQPDYHLDKDTLKAKMAMFQKENTNEYKPRNQIKKNEPKIAAEIVNQKKEDDENKEKIITSIDQKAARSVFENPVVESTPAPKTVNDIVPASNLNAARGVFSGNEKVVESFDLHLSEKEEENPYIEEITEKVPESLEVTEVTNVQDESTILHDKNESSSDSSSEADSLEAKQGEVVQEETTEQLQAEEDIQQQI